VSEVTDRAWSMPIKDLAREAGMLIAAGPTSRQHEGQALMDVLQARSAYESAMVNEKLVSKTRNLAFATWALVLATILIVGSTAWVGWNRASEQADVATWLNYEACLRSTDAVDRILSLAELEQMTFLWRDNAAPDYREQRLSEFGQITDDATLRCRPWLPEVPSV